jgi:hypothetical protein
VKIRLEFGVDAEDIEIEKDGDTIVAVTLTPQFATKAGLAAVATVEATTDKGTIKDRFSLVVSGQTGKVTKKGKSETVAAAVDEEEAAAKPPEKPTGKP